MESLILGRLEHLKRVQVEDHLLACQHCQAEYDAQRDYIEAIRAAIKSAREGPAHS